MSSPPKQSSPEVEKIVKKSAIVFFDLETTGLKVRNAEIVQIAAKCGERTFNEYVLPSGPIPSDATAINGFYIVETELGRRMYDRKCLPVGAVTIEEAMKNFINFLRFFQRPVVLVAHNCHEFDAPILLRSVRDVNQLDEFKEIVEKFSDTLPILEYGKLPMRRQTGRNYKLKDLVEEFIGSSEDMHDAGVDVQRLEELTLHPKVNVSYNDFISEAVTLDRIVNKFGIV